MEKEDFIIIGLFIFILIALVFCLVRLNIFTKVLLTCDDDFKIMDKCHCMPCSWKDAEEYNKMPCFDLNSLNLTNGN